jgi:transcriptional regulator with XRE-family HTH domain
MVNIKRTTPVTPAQIVAAREAAGLTQRQAAELLGVSRATMQNYERGTTAMPAAFLAVLAAAARKIKLAQAKKEK